MAGFNYAQNIIGLDKVKGDIHDLELSVADLSASVLSIAGDVDDLELSVADLSASVLSIGGDVDDLELSVADLSASVLDIKGDVEEITEEKNLTFSDYATVETGVTLNYGRVTKIGHNLVLVEFGVTLSETVFSPGQTKILSIANFRKNKLFAVRLGGVPNQNNYGSAVGLLDVASSGIYIDTNVTGSVVVASFIACANIVETT